MRSARFVLSVLLLSSVAASASAEPLQPTTCDETGRLCCQEWGIDLNYGNGKRWGLTTAETFADVKRKFEKDLAFDKSYCRWAGEEHPCNKMNRAHPGPPHCMGGGKTAAPDGFDRCANDVQQRLDALEKRFADQTTRLRGVQAMVDTVRAGTVGLPSTAYVPFASLASFGVALNDGAARVKRLRQNLSTACVKPTADALDKLFAPMRASGSYGGHVEGAAEDARTLQELDDLERVADAAGPPALAVPSLSLTGVKNRVVRRSGSPAGGTIVLGGLTRLDVGGEWTTSKNAPLAFVFVDKGQIEFGHVTVKRTPHPFGETLLLTAESGTHREVVEILMIGDDDGDGVLNDADKCRGKRGRAPDGCPKDPDGDGLLDDVDSCPDQNGPASNRGCPLPVAQVAAAPSGGPVRFMDPATYHWGYKDPQSGAVVIAPIFSVALEFSEGLAAAKGLRSAINPQEDPPYGFIDVTGQFVIQPRFDNCGTGHGLCVFHSGRAMIYDNTNAYYIDRAGNYVGPAVLP